ncbi:hypothetical protein BD626DRAFT_566511 [Schizophyllum amplum]|uniref:Protein kinase domain-containing protein n=1 Tax=Schizophyllum amplum TaxID=97359 RepID=A0A550CM28_9AGAR|nr:hypothetical protein BD626DRAFT_566511 [Auriculariopsis ampla]
MSLLDVHWDTGIQKMWCLSRNAHPVPEHLRAAFVRPLIPGERRGKPRVYVAEFGLVDSCSHHPVILKFAWNEAERAGLDRELAFYENELLLLQGRVVPTVYGYFDGSDASSGRGCSVLVMEYCASGPARSVEYHHPDVQSVLARILSTNISVYELLEDEHFVRTSCGDLRVVGFARAKKADVQAKAANSAPTSSNSSYSQDPRYCSRYGHPLAVCATIGLTAQRAGVNALRYETDDSTF